MGQVRGEMVVDALWNHDGTPHVVSSYSTPLPSFHMQCLPGAKAVGICLEMVRASSEGAIFTSTEYFSYLKHCINMKE